MPELPEVETIARGLNRDLRGRKILGLWTDWPKYFKLHKSEAAFRRHVIKKKITGVTRRAKNVLIHLKEGSGKEHLMLIHQKMSGHLMIGKWQRANRKLIAKLREEWQNQKWIPVVTRGPLADPKNRFIRLIFFLDNGEMLALSDLRRFAKAICGPKEEILSLSELANLGPEPLERSFTYGKFLGALGSEKREIKQVLLDPYIISGIGNIYTDEILWTSKIHPRRKTNYLKNSEKKIIYTSIKKILKRAVRLRGTSIDDYRDHKGKKGSYNLVRLVYQREGEPCKRCGTKIVRIKISNRSAHLCPKCQVL